MLPIISVQIAARLIDLPLIEPELSIRSVTIVSLKLFSVSEDEVREDFPEDDPSYVMTVFNLNFPPLNPETERVEENYRLLLIKTMTELALGATSIVV